MDWIFRDPLRGLSIDKFPYSRNEDEIPLDFMFKGAMYIPSWFVCVAFGPVSASVFVGLWFGINFVRRNSK